METPPRWRQRLWENKLKSAAMVGGVLVLAGSLSAIAWYRKVVDYIGGEFSDDR